MAAGRNSGSIKKIKSPDLDKLGVEVIGNVPPQASDVEEEVLGAMLLEANCVDMALGELTPSCFYDPKHRLIFEVIGHLVNEHTPVDAVSVSLRLKAIGEFDNVGGAIAIAKLSQLVGSAAHIEYYIKVLKEKNIQRELITAAYNILHNAYDDAVNVDELIDMAQTKVYDAVKDNVKREVQDIGSAINAAIKKMEEMKDSTGLSGVPSGYPSIDVKTLGWQPSDLIILAARPSVGKTAFALNIARNAAVDHNMPVAVFSLEMPAIQLASRLMVTETGLEASKIKGGSRLEDYEWKQLEVKLRDLSKAPLYIDDTPSLQISEFRSKAKNLVHNQKVRLIIVDYLQLMQGPQDLRSVREQEVAAISRTLKATAKELNVPIIALSQLSRDAVKRQGSGGRPQLSDLRESGSIEQDADMVIFIHRPDFVGLSESPEDKEKAEIIIAKHRNGEVFDVDMRYKANQIKFVEKDDSLAAQAGYYTTESAMNNMSSDEFGM